MTTFTLIYGSQTFRNNSAKVNAFVVSPPNKREFPSKVLQSVAKLTKTPAAIDGYEEHGLWYTNVLAHDSSKIIQLQVSTTYRGAPYSNGALLISLREDAPLVQVNVNLRHDPNAVYSEVPAFVGRGDILSLDEASDLGIKVPNYIVNTFYDAEEIEEIFDIDTLAAGTPKPEMTAVRTSTGEIKKISITPERNRRVRIRR